MDFTSSPYFTNLPLASPALSSTDDHHQQHHNTALLDEMRSLPSSYPVETNSPMFSDSDIDESDDDHDDIRLPPSTVTVDHNDNDKVDHSDDDKPTTSVSQCSYLSLPSSNNFIPQSSIDPLEDDPDFMPPSSQQHYMAMIKERNDQQQMARRNTPRAARPSTTTSESEKQKGKDDKSKKRQYHKTCKPRGVEVTNSQKNTLNKVHTVNQKQLQATLPFFINNSGKKASEVPKNKRGRPPTKPLSEFDSQANTATTTGINSSNTTTTSTITKRKNKAGLVPLSNTTHIDNSNYSDHNVSSSPSSSSPSKLIDLTNGPITSIPYPTSTSLYHNYLQNVDHVSTPSASHSFQVIQRDITAPGYNNNSNSDTPYCFPRQSPSHQLKINQVVPMTIEEINRKERAMISDNCRIKEMERNLKRKTMRQTTIGRLFDGKLMIKPDQRPQFQKDGTTRKRYMFAEDEMFPEEIFPLNTSGHTMLSNAKMLRLIPEDDIAYMMFHRFHMMVKGRNATNLYGISPVFDHLHDHYFLNLCLLKALTNNTTVQSSSSSSAITYATTPPSNLLTSVSQAIDYYKYRLIPLREKLASATLTSWKSTGILCACSDDLCLQHNLRKPHLYVCNGTWYIDRGATSSPTLYTHEEQRLAMQEYFRATNKSCHSQLSSSTASVDRNESNESNSIRHESHEIIAETLSELK